MYLAFGASRFEACKPIARDALRLALTPNINQMRSVSPFPSPPLPLSPIALSLPLLTKTHAHPQTARHRRPVLDPRR